MASIQQSIEIMVPVQAAYNQLTQFEDYPRFMEEIETVRQIDDTHLHWTTVMSNRTLEWDAEIVEQEPDRCIAWRNTSGPTNGGRLDVAASGADATRVTMTLESEPQQVPGSAGGSNEQEMSLRVKTSLARLKDFLEARGSETGAWRGEVRDAEVTTRDRDARIGQGQAMGGQQDAQNLGAQDLGMGQRMGDMHLQAGNAGGLSEEAAAPGAPEAPRAAVEGDRIGPAAGADTAGGTDLGTAPSADDTRTGTGTASGSGTAPVGLQGK